MGKNQQVRVLLIAGDHFPPNPGGMATTNYDLASGLAVESLVCLTNVDAATSPPDGRYRVYVSHVFEPAGKLKQLFKIVRLLLTIRFKYKPNLIILEACWTGNVALWFHKAFRWPLIILAHGTEFLKLTGRKWDKPYQSLKAASRILSNSHYCNSLLEEIGIDKSKVEIVYRGTDLDEFHPLPKDEIDEFKRELSLEDKRIILTVANLQRLKGHDMVIRALPGVLKEFPDTVYLIVGVGREEAYLKDMVRKTRVKDQVRFYPNVAGKEEAKRFYNICDIFVMPSRYVPEEKMIEGFGIAFIEAGACAKPVIGGRSGGIPDAIAEGESGLLVDPEDPADIAAAILKLFHDPTLARRLGEQGRERVLKRFTRKEMLDKILAICEEVININPDYS